MVPAPGRPGLDARARRLALLLFLAVTALHLPSVRNGFVYDDHEVILLQRAPAGVLDVARLFAEPHGLPLSRLPYYRAPTRASLLVQKALHGDVAAPFHLVNALLGGAAAALVFALLRRPAFGLAPGPAALGAALFGAHPILSACVHPIASGRETLLPAVFALAALVLLLQRSAGARAGGVLSFAVALLGKEQMIVLPAVVAWADWLGMSEGGPGRSARRLAWRLAPLVLVVAGYLALRAAIFGVALSRGDAPPLALQPGGPPLSALFAVQSTFAPFATLRYEPLLAAWWSPARAALAAALLLAAALDGLLRDTVERRRTLFWLGLAGLFLLPSANLVRQETPFDERFVLLSSVGAAALVAASLGRRWHRPGWRAPLVAASAAAIVALGLVSWQRGASYRDALTFQRQWAETSPGLANARFAYGTALLRAGDTAAARRELAEAVRLSPGHVAAHFNLAVLLAEEGRLEDAATHFRAVLREDPADAEARANLAQLLELLGRGAEAGALRAEAPAR